MRRSLFACTAAAGLILAPGIVWAGGGYADGACANGCGHGYGHRGRGWNGFWHGVHVDFYRNNSWPEPFSTADKAVAREPWGIMADNGWKMQNTIGTFLYDRETQRLNTAGELLVKWIVTQAPQHRRVVFVLKGDTADATAARMESVQEAVARYASGHVCPIVPTDTEPAGWSAAYIDSITQQFNSTIPAPRLPASSGPQAGGSGGGGGGGQ